MVVREWELGKERKPGGKVTFIEGRSRSLRVLLGGVDGCSQRVRQFHVPTQLRQRQQRGMNLAEATPKPYTVL